MFERAWEMDMTLQKWEGFVQSRHMIPNVLSTLNIDK